MENSRHEREDLPKVQEYGRQMSKVPDCEYGKKAQVNFGEKVMRTSKGSQKQWSSM